MKIGVDARLYGLKHRGLGRYLKEILDRLARLDQQNDYLVFLTKDNWQEFQTDNPRVKKVLLDIRWYSLAEQFIVPLKLKKYKLDLMYWPHFNLPYFYKGRSVLTVHDLIINHFPHSRATTLPKWLYSLKLLGYKSVIKRAINRAEKIIVPSEFVKKDILENYKIEGEKIFVIYEGCSLKNINQATKGTLSDFNISKPYLLYVGAAYPHKNLEFLIKNFEKFNSQENFKYQLALVGGDDFFYQRLRKSFDNPDIIFTGQVSDNQLSVLYSSARLFVFPSLFEGFGLPPLEAQAHSLPVLSADSSALPEVLWDSVLYFNPRDQKEFLLKLKEILEDQALRERLQAKGLENIKRFDWLKTAEEIHNHLLA
ncbi:MAG: hypothetical protein COU22_01870 [Candidatus Komeilibacteria bacterium CG10_big_fil_rev_8_21_14_0_10_41_13]|uniref:Glycosyltransferase family 1 protein n=1 Tax=Candidatus Komeilibacteria bacterium CG10_big_fil_rev_8_21_14_0_10_41_13 TaxID=1974476 RepID=A0A2M6WCM9_9BACT|nr:MAG: hypothetical protein COU22_01870 [Candidatus Komeilibacteria bacterium CG10_big_fil_rev_8_21_14_0_10_41_13]